MNDSSARPSLSSPPPAAATDAWGRGRRSQSAVPSDDDYLVPKQNVPQQAMYLDFPAAEPGGQSITNALKLRLVRSIAFSGSTVLECGSVLESDPSSYFTGLSS